MIVQEPYNEELVKTYSNSGYKIQPIYDRTGNKISEHAIYDVAIDILIDGQARFDYAETDEPVEKPKEE